MQGREVWAELCSHRANSTIHVLQVPVAHETSLEHRSSKQELGYEVLVEDWRLLLKSWNMSHWRPTKSFRAMHFYGCGSGWMTSLPLFLAHFSAMLLADHNTLQTRPPHSGKVASEIRAERCSGHASGNIRYMCVHVLALAQRQAYFSILIVALLVGNVLALPRSRPTKRKVVDKRFQFSITNKAPKFDLCPTCVSFTGQALDILLNIILSKQPCACTGKCWIKGPWAFVRLWPKNWGGGLPGAEDSLYMVVDWPLMPRFRPKLRSGHCIDHCLWLGWYNHSSLLAA